MLNLLAIKEQPVTATTIDNEVQTFRENCALNEQINKILKSDIPEWSTPDLQEGLSMLQDVLLDRLGLKDIYNKGIVTAIVRIIHVLQARKVDFTLRVPQSLLPN